MKRFIKELNENRLIIIIILLTVILTSLFNTYLKKDYSRVNNETTDFVSAKVTEVTSSEVEYDNNLDINLGEQVVKVEILEGKLVDIFINNGISYLSMKDVDIDNT